KKMESFKRLVELVETLRGENGCPWDKKQTEKSFKTFLLEEVYELIEAIEEDNIYGLKEELGDLLFHILFIAQISRERGRFDIVDVIDFVYEKMRKRHPHVFHNGDRDKPVERMWEEIKKEEKRGGYSLLSNIPKEMPALLKAYIISKKVARVGFDWENIEDVYKKLQEELSELKKAEESGNEEEIREEIGDILFTIVNISRFYRIDPEDALRSSSEKFIRRFNYVERQINPSDSSLATMDRLWEEVKSKEKKRG
ncbi:MAG: nucleoside triphosphate pyrophosphohydrolase, partial [Syntrophorhabdaceae bacterium]|nr:nucleoside triphosphate pyrophosphohydrolase [Syntrophorhabdaceae bacterium]